MNEDRIVSVFMDNNPIGKRVGHPEEKRNVLSTPGKLNRVIA